MALSARGFFSGDALMAADTNDKAGRTAAILYVLLVLVFAGGSGIWVPLFTPGHILGMEAVFAFVMGALTSVGTDMVLRHASTVTTQVQRLTLMVLSALSSMLALIAFLQEKNEPACWILAVLSIVLCVIVWYNVYKGHAMFRDEPEPVPPGTGVAEPGDLAGAGVP
jgi:hypothetical protein